MDSKGTYIPELSTWRFLFILMIFFHHVELFPGGGATGVAFFFILGGFTLTLGYSDRVLKNGFEYGSYLKKRLIKFYPLHWLILLLFVPLNLLCSVPVSIKTFVPNFLLVQSFIPIKEFFYSYNSPSWYLCNTVFFAVLFPFIYKLFSRIKGMQWLWFALVLVVLIVAECFTPEGYWLPILYINPLLRTFDFVIGMLTAMAFKKMLYDDSWGGTFKKKMAFLLMLVCLIFIAILSLASNGIRMRAFLYWMPMALMILSTAVVSATSKNIILGNKLLISLGNVSFAFYMIHSLVIQSFDAVFSKLGVTNQCITVPVMLMVTIAGSYLVTSYFVTPVTKWLSNKLINKTA